MCIFQDNDGFMWFGTQAGAIKYNGRQMNTYTSAPDQLSSNVVFDIAQDSKGNIYFATLKGITLTIQSL